MRTLIFILILGFVRSAVAMVTYTDDVKVILDKYCVECHDSIAHDPDFSRYPFPSESYLSQFAIGDKLLYVVSAQVMPPGIRPKLKPNEVAVIQNWIEGGMVE